MEFCPHFAGLGKGVRRAIAAALAATVLGTSLDAMAELNSFEANTRGEFGIGSAVQFGSADLRCMLLLL